MNIGTTYEPIRFVKVPAAVQKLQWSPESKVKLKEKILSSKYYTYLVYIFNIIFGCS